MFHPDTKFLIDHWTGLARATGVRGGIPTRAALLPEAFGRRLPQVFVAERQESETVLTLAGTALDTFWRRPLAGEALTALWTPTSAALIEQAVQQAVREARPIVVAGFTPGEPSLAIEMVIAPLRGPADRANRILGLFAPAAALTPSSGDAPRLTARLAMGAGIPGRPPLSLAVIEGRRIA